MSSSAESCAQRALKISAKARYALRIVLDVAVHMRSGQLRSGAAIAQAQNISEKFLSRIVIPLRERGILASVRGVNGGFRLACPPEDISLLDIVETVQGPLAVLDCLLPGSVCDRLNTCLARKVWSDVNTAFANTLARQTVATIMTRNADVVEALDYCI